MAYALMGLGGLIGLIGFACAIIVIIAAFKEAPVQGLLCFFCGPYLLYYAFAKFNHNQKGLILGGMLSSFVLSSVLYGVGGFLMAKDMSDAAVAATEGVVREAAQESSAAGGDSVGVAECDDYIKKFETCVSDKVPDVAKAQMKQSLDTMRSSWKQAAATPQGKVALAQACSQAAAAAKASMSAYGCSF